MSTTQELQLLIEERDLLQKLCDVRLMQRTELQRQILIVEQAERLRELEEENDQ